MSAPKRNPTYIARKRAALARKRRLRAYKGKRAVDTRPRIEPDGSPE